MRHGHEDHDRRYAHGRSRDHDHDHGHSHLGRREHGGRAARMFEHGELRLVVLALIAERPRHGYEIIRAIEEQAGGSYSPSPGVIYPTLTMLEELGHVTVAETDGRKLHAITADGSDYLAAHAPAVTVATDRVRAAGAALGGGPAPEVVRATENLKLALRLRQGRGPLTETQARAIAEALDAAAIAIERS